MAMKQQTFASQSSFEKYGRKSRREHFLDEMELVVPWAELQALAEGYANRKQFSSSNLANSRGGTGRLK